MPYELPLHTERHVVTAQVDKHVNDGMTLELAQQRVADHYSFLTWRQLLLFLDIANDERIDFDHLACLTYVWWDQPSRRDQARDMLQENPELERRSIYSACTAGNTALVEEFLNEDPSLLDQRGGYFDWEPLLYACYSRLNHPDRSTSDVIHLLLDRGANPNAYYLWGGIYVFSALTGVFGEGERGPINQPEHPDFRVLAERLLKAGANCNDSQTLYNRMFRPDNTALNMLLDHGLNKSHGCNWRATVKDRLVENPEKTLDYQLQWAVKNNFTDRVDILLAHGADATQTLPNDGSLIKIARTRGFNQVADELESHGALPYKLTEVEQFLNYCLSGDESNARTLLEANANLVNEANAHNVEAMNQASEVGNLEAVSLMLKLGFSVHGKAASTPIHHAAHHGHLSLVEHLLDNGASIHRREPFYFATPLGWAQAGNKVDVMAYLEEQDIGIFDLINVGDLARVKTYLDAHPESLDKPLRDEVAAELQEHPHAWQTPLAYAAVRDKTAIVELLLTREANKTLASDDGTPLIEFCNDEVKALLA